MWRSLDSSFTSSLSSVANSENDTLRVLIKASPNCQTNFFLDKCATIGIVSKVFLSLLVILITGPATFMTALAIDLGGTKLSLAVLSQEGTMLYKEYTALDHRKGQEVGLLITAEINNKKRIAGV